MRKQFAKTVEDLMAQDERLVLLLGDIGVFGFRNAFKMYPERTYNIGICEQAMTSVAAGLAKEGLIPVLHSIAPFIVERAFEQIKVDFGYQGLGGNFVSVGGSYDYAGLGCTHHCPSDVALLKTIPDFQVIVPGSAQDFDVLFRALYSSSKPTYFRLSEFPHTLSVACRAFHAAVVRQGESGTLLAVGPLLDRAVDACADLDVTVLYYTTLAPFDAATLAANCPTHRVAVVAPFYEGTLSYDIQQALCGRPVEVLDLGVPRRFLTSYGRAAEHDTEYGLAVEQLRQRLREFFS